MTPNQLDELIQVFKSPDTEASIAKGIPICLVDIVLKGYKGLYRVKYRGPSTANYIREQAFIHKAHAETFALYYNRTSQQLALKEFY
jgi:hypothetical protein